MRTVLPRLLRAWGSLRSEQRLAGVAAGLLFVTMFLPWYQQNAVVSSPRSSGLVSRNLSALAVFSFVEFAVLLVAVAVLVLLFARGERRSFHMPGSDGAVILAGGVWVAVLLIWRLFDKPGVISHGIAANVGIQWGMFFALACAGLLAVAGQRLRSLERPEAPVRRRPRVPVSFPPAPGRSRATPPRATPRAKPSPSEQLSFEEDTAVTEIAPVGPVPAEPPARAPE